MTQTTAHAHAAGNNDNATRRVPDSEKKSTLSVAMVTAGYCICMSGLFTGASMAAGMSLRNAIIASIIGNLILSVYGCAVGVAGAKEGVSTSILARHSFGRNGSKIIGVLLAVVMLGWFSVQVGFFGDTIHAMFPNAGFITNKYFAAFWGGILMLLTAYFGYKGLNILSYIAVPLIALIATIGVVVSVNQACLLYTSSEARCILLFSQGDVATNQFLIENNKENDMLDTVMQEQVRAKERERLQQMVLYCHTSGCLRHYILRYFGEKGADYCGHCSSCCEQFEQVNITAIAQIFLTAVQETGQQYGACLLYTSRCV